VYEVGPLLPGTSYLPPQENDIDAQTCDCNTVMYALYMACTACQNVTTMSWSSWSRLCSESQIGRYPGKIPPDITIPQWAFQDYTVGEYFDFAAAKEAGDSPEVFQDGIVTVVLYVPTPTGSTSGTSLISTSLSSLPLTSVSPTSSPTGDNTKGTKSSSGVTATITAVLGALAFLAVVSIGAWVFLRRRARARADLVNAAMSESGTRPPRLYDPSDPSTFPSQNHDETN